MSQENVEVVRRALAALDRRDVEAYLEVASPQIELITPALPLQGPITGHSDGEVIGPEDLPCQRDTWFDPRLSELWPDSMRRVSEQFTALTKNGPRELPC
jgi:hypothetical protein